jgi:hypothetical protein
MVLCTQSSGGVYEVCMVYTRCTQGTEPWEMYTYYYMVLLQGRAKTAHYEAIG